MWLLKSSDQFDYVSSYKRTVTLTLRGSAALYQRGNEVVARGLGDEYCGKLLAIVVMVRGAVAVISPQLVGAEGKLWLVVKEIQRHASLGHRLTEGDVIRLGQSQWQLTEICLLESPSADHSILSQSNLELEETSQPPCKICLSTIATPDNPLVSPCNCKGSVQYTHVKCLDAWIGSQRRNYELKYDKKYMWKAVQCSVCKSQLEMDVQTEARTFHNLGVPKPVDDDYIAVRSVDSKEQEIHIWQWNGHHSLSIGSGAGNKIQLSSDEVSDEHAVLRSRKGLVYLQDHNSQYGTSVLVQKPIALTAGSRTTVQCGNVVLTLALKEKRGLLKCLSGPSLRKASEDEMTAAVEEAKGLMVR